MSQGCGIGILSFKVLSCLSIITFGNIVTAEHLVIGISSKALCQIRLRIGDVSIAQFHQGKVGIHFSSTTVYVLRLCQIFSSFLIVAFGISQTGLVVVCTIVVGEQALDGLVPVLLLSRRLYKHC